MDSEKSMFDANVNIENIYIFYFLMFHEQETVISF